MRIGFIGVGRMGVGMALNLTKAGHELIVYDARRESAKPVLESGAHWAESVTELAESVSVVFTSLPGPVEMQQVSQTLIDTLRPGSVWFDLTTNSPATVRQVCADCAERQIALLDAPVSGGPSGAASGKLAIYVGGDQGIFDKHRDLLDAIGDEVMFVGAIGAGNSAKLVHNSASFALRLMLAEVFTLGVKAGVEPAALWHAMRTGGQGRSRTFDRLADKYLVDNYEPASFTVRLAHKDLGLSLDLARQLEVPMKFTQATYDEFDAAIQRGWADRDSRTPMALQNERANVQIKMTPQEVSETLAKG
jgi:3-hydroxyisobutyrate dehydrogenase